MGTQDLVGIHKRGLFIVANQFFEVRLFFEILLNKSFTQVTVKKTVCYSDLIKIFGQSRT